jgi:hypothetical protein
MNLILSFPLAETTLADVSMEYREVAVDSGIPMWAYAAAAIGLAAIGFAVFAWINRSPAILNTPLGMLHELCKTHHISGRGRRLLECIAQEASLDHPAILFAGPEHFEACVDQTRSSIDFQSKHASTLGMLRRKLYG